MTQTVKKTDSHRYYSKLQYQSSCNKKTDHYEDSTSGHWRKCCIKPFAEIAKTISIHVGIQGWTQSISWRVCKE